MTTSIDRRLLSAAALGFAVLVAACGSSNASPTPSVAPASVAPASASAAPSESAPAPESAGPSASNGPQMSLSAGQAADLEAMLPSTIGSTQLVKSSFDGSQMPAAGTPIDQSNLDPVLKKYGKSMSDVRFAMAVPPGGATSLTTGAIYAIQLKGVPASSFMTDISGMDVSSSSTVGGKTVYGAAASGAPIGSYVYPKDDILFVVLASPTDAPGIFSSLP